MNIIVSQEEVIPLLSLISVASLSLITFKINIEENTYSLKEVPLDVKELFNTFDNQKNVMF